MRFIDNHHFFDWCSLFQKMWSNRVQKNPKTRAVNEKLDLWHRQNPSEGPIVNLAAWRIRRAQRAVAASRANARANGI